MENNKTSFITGLGTIIICIFVGFLIWGPETEKQTLSLPEFDKTLASNGILQATEYLEKTKGDKKELEIFISFKTPVLNTGRETDTLNKIKNKFSKDYKKIKVALVHDTSGSYMTRDYELKDGKFEEVK